MVEDLLNFYARYCLLEYGDVIIGHRLIPCNNQSGNLIVFHDEIRPSCDLWLGRIRQVFCIEAVDLCILRRLRIEFAFILVEHFIHSEFLRRQNINLDRRNPDGSYDEYSWRRLFRPFFGGNVYSKLSGY